MMATEPTEQEKALTDKLACFIVNYPYEFIEAILLIARQQGGANLNSFPDTDMSYKIKSFMPQIAALRKERGA